MSISIVMFRHNFAHMVNSLSILVDITLMINVLKEIIKDVKNNKLVLIPQRCIREK